MLAKTGSTAGKRQPSFTGVYVVWYAVCICVEYKRKWRELAAFDSFVAQSRPPVYTEKRPLGEEGEGGVKYSRAGL